MEIQVNQKWIAQKFNEHIWFGFHQYGNSLKVRKPDQVEFFDFKNNKYFQIKRVNVTYNETLKKYISEIRPFGSVRDELIGNLREEGNYNHKMIEKILDFWDSLERNPVFLIFHSRDDFEKTALTIQWQYLNFKVF